MNASGVIAGHGIKGIVTSSLFILMAAMLAFSGIAVSSAPVQAIPTYATYPLVMTTYVNQYFSYQFALIGTPYCSTSPTYHWEIYQPPSWMTISPTGLVGGIPTATGTVLIRVRCHETGTGGCNCPCYIKDSYTNSTNWTTITLNIVDIPLPPQPPNAPATYDFRVKIGTGLSSGTTRVLIDGMDKGSPTGGEARVFTSPLGLSHVVTVDKSVSNPSQAGTRFTVKGSNEVTVSESNLLAYFDYAPSVLIDVSVSPPGVAQTSGGGWYAAGDTFNASTSGTADDPGMPGKQYRFKQWTLPDGSARTDKNLTFTVSAPGTATAVYDTYYLLTLSSDYPEVNETSWYASGTTATYDLSLQEAPMLGFWGLLGGKMKAVSDKGTHIMNAPFTQKISWTYDYTIPIIIICVAFLVLAGIIYLALRRRSLSSGIAAVPMGNSLPSSGSSSPLDSTRVVAATTATVEKKTAPAPDPDEVAKFCAKCGTPADKDADFCKKCGAKLS